MNTIKDARYNLGIAYLNDAQYNEAIPEFKAVIELDPEYINAHCGLSRAYLEQNDLAKAEESTLAALKVNSEHTLALSLIDSINKAYYDKGISDLHENQYRDAVISFQRIINQDSNFEHVHYNIGLAYIGLREYDNAIKSFTTALDSDSVSDDIHLQIGVAYIEVKQFDNAIRHLEQAKNTDPNLIEVQYNLARSYREIGNLEASTNAATETLRIDPEYAPIRDLVEKIKQTHYNRGVSFLNDERLSEAVASFQNAISLDAEFTAAHFNLGLVLLRMESYSRAIEALRNTVELDRNHKAAFHALSLAYFGQHEVGKARKAAQDAIDIDPDYQPARALLEAIDPNFTSLRTTTPLKTQENIQPESNTTEEQILKETKQSQENNDNSQKEDVKIDVEQDPDLKKTIQRGMIFLGNSQYRQAESAFKKVIKADPSCVDAHYGLGKTYFEVGAFDDAKSAAEEAIKLNPQHIYSHDLLKMIKHVTHLNKKQIIRKKVLIYAAVISIILFGVYVANQYRIITIPGISNTENNNNDRNTTDNRNDNGTKNGKPSNRNSVLPKPLIKVSLENKSDKVMIIAGEEKSIKLSINNKGDTLNNVKVTIDSKIRGLTFALPAPISRIPKDRSHDVEIGIAANDNVKTGKPDLKVHLNDHHGNSIAKTDVPINILNLESVE